MIECLFDLLNDSIEMCFLIFASFILIGIGCFLTNLLYFNFNITFPDTREESKNFNKDDDGETRRIRSPDIIIANTKLHRHR